MSAVYLHPPAWLTALGRGAAARDRLFGQEPQGTVTQAFTPGRELHVGSVQEALPALDHLPKRMRSRSNALLLAVLPELRASVEALRERHGPHRLAVVLGVSAAGLQEGVAAARNFTAQGRWP
jgi:3-oxoacyl-[acyl-carrier-protein] synthase I